MYSFSTAAVAIVVVVAVVVVAVLAQLQLQFQFLDCTAGAVFVISEIDVDLFVVAEVAAVEAVVAAVVVAVVAVAVVVVVMGLSGWRWQHGLVKQVRQTHSSQHSSGDAEPAIYQLDRRNI